MAFHNTNWQAVNLPVGTYGIGELGDGLSASTVHEIFCLTSGSIDITAKGGGTFTWSATAGQNIKVMVRECVVGSGEFVGFKVKHQQNYTGR